MRPFAPACEGNKAPILDMLRRAFADQRAVIERLGGERGLLDRMRLSFDYTPIPLANRARGAARLRVRRLRVEPDVPAGLPVDLLSRRKSENMSYRNLSYRP